jgi:hypothetical protein
MRPKEADDRKLRWLIACERGRRPPPSYDETELARIARIERRYAGWAREPWMVGVSGGLGWRWSA